MSRRNKRPAYARPTGGAAADTTTASEGALAAETSPGAASDAMVDATPPEAPAPVTAPPADALAPAPSALPLAAAPEVAVTPAEPAPAAPVVPDPPSPELLARANEETIAGLRRDLDTAHVALDGLRSENERLQRALDDVVHAGRADLDAMQARLRVQGRDLDVLRDENAKLRALLTREESAALDGTPVTPEAPAPAPAVESVTVEMHAVVHHSSLMFRGRIYEPGAPFPFDPQRPPRDVLASFVEGIHYRFAPRG